MGIQRSPRIVKDGLLLHFDAASERSYTSGSSTWLNLSDYGSQFDATGAGSIDWDNLNGGRMIMNNTNDYFNINGGSSISQFNTGSYTKICVFRIEPKLYQNLISSDVGPHAFWIDNTSTTVLSAGHSGNYHIIDATVPDMQNKWNWAAQTFDSTTGFQIYYNGTFVTSSATTTGMTAQGGIRLAQWNLATVNNLSGSMAIAMVYNRVLSAAEMLQNYNAVKTRFDL